MTSAERDHACLVSRVLYLMGLRLWQKPIPVSTISDQNKSDLLCEQLQLRLLHLKSLQTGHRERQRNYVHKKAGSTPEGIRRQKEQKEKRERKRERKKKTTLE